MADSGVFESVCAELEQRSSLDRLEARGTVRIVLKEAGLESRSVTCEQMRVAIERLLGPELESRGVADVAGLCAQLTGCLDGLAPGPAREPAETPEAVFGRLGGL